MTVAFITLPGSSSSVIVTLYVPPGPRGFDVPGLLSRCCPLELSEVATAEVIIHDIAPAHQGVPLG